ncbi:MAG: hypothetical protein OXC05_08505 [Halieaceae bacterium]|nr:hypothetical protein [Halieaceae bacterium]
METHPETKEIWFLISLVYNNGFFSNHASPTGIIHSDESWKKVYADIDSAEITSEGDLTGDLPGLRAKSDEIYEAAVEAHEKHQRGEDKQEFPKGGFPGPWVKFRR